MMNGTFYITPQDTKAFVLSDSASNVYEKELIYVGTFKTDEGVFDVTDELIDHWVNEFAKMSENEIEVPVPLEHTNDPAKRRGTLIALRAGVDDKGRYGLFGKIEFNDSKDAARKNQVSIFVPPEYTDGLGNKYIRPVRHVALTDYPVVPGLQGFEKVLVASLVRKVKTMDNLIQLLNDELGLGLEPGSNEAMVYKAVKSAIDAAKLAPPPTDDTPPDDEELADPPEETEEEKKKRLQQQSISASVAKLVASSRIGVIDGLVSDGKITTAVANKLKERYTSKEKITMAFSQATGEFSDDFDNVVEALKLNDKVIKFGEKTGGQVLPKGDANPLVADAEARRNK